MVLRVAHQGGQGWCEWLVEDEDEIVRGASNDIYEVNAGARMRVVLGRSVDTEPDPPPYWDRVKFDLTGGAHVQPGERERVKPWLAHIQLFWNDVDQTLRFMFASAVVWDVCIERFLPSNQAGYALLCPRHGSVLEWNTATAHDVQSLGAGFKVVSAGHPPSMPKAFATARYKDRWYNFVQVSGDELDELLVFDATGSAVLDRMRVARPCKCTKLQLIGALWSDNLLLIACRANLFGRRVTWVQRFAKLRRVFTDSDPRW